MRKVQGKHNSSLVRSVLAEHGEYLVLVDGTDDGACPTVNRVKDWEPYTPTPKVGEVWFHQYPSNGSMGWLVIDVNPKLKYWRMIEVLTLVNMSTDMYRGERCDRISVYTRPLPETKMTKGESNA